MNGLRNKDRWVKGDEKRGAGEGEGRKGGAEEAAGAPFECSQLSNQ